MIPDHTDGYFKSLYQQMVQAFLCIRFPFSLYAIGFIRTRPRGHGDGDSAEWFAVVGAKLEVCALRYGEGYAGGEGGDFFAVALFAPHFALSADDVPDFFDGAVGNGDGCFSRGEFKVGHAAVFEFEEYADVRSVGCGDVGFLGQVFGAVVGHGVLLKAERCTTGSGQFINVGAVPPYRIITGQALCPPVGWLGGVR